MAGLRIGTAGIPASAKPQTTPDGIRRLAELGLDHMEIEFVRGVRMGEKTARTVGELAEELSISLTVHAPYYINLNSADPEKIEASKKRIVQAAKVGAAAGAVSVTFHAAFYHDDDPQQVYQLVKGHMEDMLEELQSIRDGLGEEALKAMHIHLSGIEYGPRGEKRHVPLEETELDYRAVLQALVDFDVAGWLTCESPILEEDALILKGLYEELHQR